MGERVGCLYGQVRDIWSRSLFSCQSRQISTRVISTIFHHSLAALFLQDPLRRITFKVFCSGGIQSLPDRGINRTTCSAVASSYSLQFIKRLLKECQVLSNNRERAFLRCKVPPKRCLFSVSPTADDFIPLGLRWEHL